MRARALSAVLLCVAACKSKDEAVRTVPFSDDFERAELGPDWYPSGGQWKIDQGAVYSTGANNAPCFLKVRLPADVVVEVDVHSETSIVDAKVEMMTDGRTHQSGYVFILGGWSNKISAIARLDEHGADRREKSPTEVKGPGTYHWRIEKLGGKIRWYLDGELYLSFDDPEPLDGPGHDRFALSNWQNRVRWDNLRIWAHADAPPLRAPGAAP